MYSGQVKDLWKIIDTIIENINPTNICWNQIKKMKEKALNENENTSINIQGQKQQDTKLEKENYHADF